MLSKTPNITPSSCNINLTQISAGIALIMAISAVALIVIGHLKIQSLLLPGYYLAGGAGVLALISMVSHYAPRCLNRCATPLSKEPTSAKVLPLPREGHFRGAIVSQTLPHHSVKINPQDLTMLNIANGSPVLFGKEVYTVVADSNVNVGHIWFRGSPELNCTYPPLEQISLGEIIKPFQNYTTADQLEISLTIEPGYALLYSHTHLQQQLMEQMQGQILHKDQKSEFFLPVDKGNITWTQWVDGGIQTEVSVIGGIADGEYKQVAAQTHFNISGSDTTSLVAVEEIAQIKQASLTFQLIGVEDHEHYSLYPRTNAQDPTPMDDDEKLMFGLANIDLDALRAEEIKRQAAYSGPPPLQTLVPLLKNSIKQAKTKIDSWPNPHRIVSKDTLWKIGELLVFEHKGYRYIVRLSNIQAEGKTYSYAAKTSDKDSPLHISLTPLSNRE